MKKIFKNNLVTAVALIAASFAFFPATSANAAAVIDAYNSSVGNVAVSNYTKNPGSSSSWYDQVSADAGEVVSVGIYFANAGPDAAQNLTVRLTPAASGQNNSYTFTGTITAANAQTVTESATINLTSSQTLTWLGNVTLVRDGSGDGSSVSNPDPLFNSGLVVGNVANYGYGTVVARFQVGNSNSNNNQNPSVTTNSVTNTNSNSATLNGYENANGNSQVTTWFEYGTSSGNYQYTNIGRNT